MYWNEPTSFSFVDDLVKEITNWFSKESPFTPMKASFKENENKKLPLHCQNNKTEKISLPIEINILKESDINLKSNSTTKNHTQKQP